ncbi:hypothetical protein ATCC90586_005132 [Pythium insidiosum]|nr:hypothetical protein ATCC90586_005132 [Pythium insidiosum]
MSRRRRSLVVELSHVGAVALALLVQTQQQLPRLVPPVGSPAALPALFDTYCVSARAPFSTAATDDDPSVEPQVHDDDSSTRALLHRLRAEAVAVGATSAARQLDIERD